MLTFARTTVLGLAALVFAPAALAQEDHAVSPKLFRPPTPTPAPAGGEEKVVIGGVTFPTGIYDEKAVGATQIREAAARAKKENRRILIMWGENHCGFCFYLTEIYKNDPRIKQLLAGDYELVKIDIGHDFNKHIDLAQFYQTDLLTLGAPTLTILDPKSDRMVAVLDSKLALSKKAGEVFDAEVIQKFLATNVPPAQIAQSVLADGKDAAAKTGKRVLINFSAPLCEPCDLLGAWLADPVVNAILTKAYVIVKIDVQRMQIGRDVLTRIAATKNVVEPWLIVVNPDESPVPPAVVMGAPVGGAAIGLPGLPRKSESVDAFVRLIVGPDLGGGKLTADDEKSLRESVMARLPK